MTLNEYVVAANAYRLREEDEWNRTRNLMAVIMNFAGMGVDKDGAVTPSDIIQLSMDDEDIVTPIATKEEALRLIETM